MEKNKLLQQLATYDFSGPVRIQTIIEDSDDEHYSENEMPPKCSAAEKTTITSQVDLANNTFNNCNQFLEHYSPELQKNEIDQKKCKRKPSNAKDSQNKKAKRLESNEIISSNINTIKNLNQDNNNLNNTKFVKNSLDTNLHSLNETKKSTENNPLKINIQINQFEKVSMYISDLLTSVSKQLLKVIEAYNLYTNVVTNTNSTPIHKEELLKLYLRTREQCFNLSYNTVLNILLPEKDSTTFVNSFIDCTMKIADCQKINISHHLVRLFYFELLSWAEKKKVISGLTNNTDTNSEKCIPTNDYRTLRKQLCEPINTNQNPNLEFLEGQNQETNAPKTCIFKTGSPGNEISINVGTNVLDMQRLQKNGPGYTIKKDPNVTVAKRNFTEIPPTNIMNNSENYSLSSNSAISTYNQTMSHTDNTKFNKLYLQINGTTITQQKSVSNIHQDRVSHGPATAPIDQTKIVHSNDSVHHTKVSRPSPVPNHNQPKNVTNTNQNSYGITRFEQIQQYRNKSNLYLQPSPVNITTSQLDSLPAKMFASYQNTRNDNYALQIAQNTVNSNHYNLLNSNPMNATTLSANNDSFQPRTKRISTPYEFQQEKTPPSDETSVYWQHSIPLPCQSNLYYPHRNQLPESPCNIETTRSISTDSGFISPLNFKSTTPEADQSINTSWTETTVPLITHVTSLNPNASFMNDGMCHVCGKTTKKKCLGCMVFYYCDYKCQSKDWKSHMAICTNTAK